VATGAIDGRLRLCTSSAELYMGNAQQSVGIQHRIWSVGVADKLPYQQAILALKFSPSGKWLLVGGLNPTIQLWNVANKTLEKQYPADNGEERPRLAMEKGRPDCQRSQLSGCRMDRRLEVRNLWRRQSDTRIPAEYDETDPHTQVSCRAHRGSPNEFDIHRSFSRGHTNDINQVKCNPSSTSLASCSDDGTARTWNLQTGTSLVCSGHTAELVHVQWCPHTEHGKDELMATCAKDATTRIWNSVTGECLKVFMDHTESLFALAFCPSGQMAGYRWRRR
jgi:transducin (beta)-like 1